MRSKLAPIFCAALLICAATGAQQTYRVASPGYHYSFPRDHFSHPDFQTEWWYYTGNLKTADGHQFGFQLTFFRQAVKRDKSPSHSAWAVEDLYLAHSALSDITGGKFYHVERLNRAGPGIAGVDERVGRIWNGNWQALLAGDQQKLSVVADEWTLKLQLDSKKPPIINGENGISQKGPASGEASNYISLTRLEATGTIELNGKSYVVQGTAWMDHEFFTNQLATDQAGWDWVSVQLNDNTELMLYRMRRKDGSLDPFSSGTYVDAMGKARHLASNDFDMTPKGETWSSSTTKASYPIQWAVSLPALKLRLQITTKLREQEMTSAGSAATNYWEGAVEIAGTRGDMPASGAGYLEMTGYDKPVHFGQ